MLVRSVPVVTCGWIGGLNPHSALVVSHHPASCSALRWAALDADTQAAWATYRQALLDVPQQSGFPNSVAWPQEPSGQ